MVSEKAKRTERQEEECIINDILPFQLFHVIFLSLPMSTLLRCIGVCKLWHNIIRDPLFVTYHLKHAPRYALLFFPQEQVSCEPYPSDAVLIDEAWSQSTFAVPVIGPDDFLFGSCNGLLGLYTKKSIKIANFSTGECLHLKKPKKNLRGDRFSLYSFGFHPKTEKYKITHFLGDCVEGHRVIRVYTLGDEKWEDFRSPEGVSLNCVRNSGVVNVNGTMCWLTEDMREIQLPSTDTTAKCKFCTDTTARRHAVMSFDPSQQPNASFAPIQLPKALEDCAHGSRRYWIREIDGEICIAIAQTRHSQPKVLAGKLQIWTLNNKVEQRWSRDILFITHHVTFWVRILFMGIRS